MPQTWLIVPCYNEARRFESDQWARLSKGSAYLLFIDDGSRDGTSVMLQRLVARFPANRAGYLQLTTNLGKGEAVRCGLRHALSRGATWVGYADADLATPIEELQRLMRMLPEAPTVVLGSRVALLGTNIHRYLHRHLLGRVFATAASTLLRLRVYDTQCGAKWFRACPALQAALQRPFETRWIFDVELLARLLDCGPNSLDERDFLEVPLKMWCDKSGSKMRFRQMVAAAADLLRIGSRIYGRTRRRPGAPTSAALKQSSAG